MLIGGKMRDKKYEIKIGLTALALAGSIWGTVHSVGKHSDAMDALNNNPDYVESETLEDAADNLSSASSELEYEPERIWTDSHTRCVAHDEDGNCTDTEIYIETHRTPEDCPDPSNAKSYINNAISLLQRTGAEQGNNPENNGLEGALAELSNSLPNGNELCSINGYHACESTFANQRGILNSAASEVNAHSKRHYAKVPPGLKSDRNWSIFGIIASILGILGTGAIGGYIVYKHKEDTGFYW